MAVIAEAVAAAVAAAAAVVVALVVVAAAAVAVFLVKEEEEEEEEDILSTAPCHMGSHTPSSEASAPFLQGVYFYARSLVIRAQFVLR